MDASVALTRSEDGFMLSVEGYADVFFTETYIARSKTLQDLSGSSDVGDRVPLAIDRRMLMDWHAFASTSQQPAIHRLARTLQAADFLNDPETLQQASHELAMLAFPFTTESVQEHADHGIGGINPPPGALQVLESLPEHLVILTLQAAFQSAPPLVAECELNTCFWGGDCHAVPLQKRTQATISALLDILPAHMHALPILAHWDVLRCRDARTLTLHLQDLRTAERLIAAAAAAAATQPPESNLTSLSFISNPSENATPTAGDARDLAQAARRAIAPLATMTSLMHLSVDFGAFYHTEDEVLLPWEAWGEAFFSALRGLDVLPCLSQLKSLRVMTAWGGSEAIQTVLAARDVLTGLREIDLADNDMHHDCDAEAALCALAVELPRMSALTRLCLARAHEGRVDSAWGILRATVAALPLHALDLEGTYLPDLLPMPCDGAVESLPAPAPGHAQATYALSSLRCLRLPEGIDLTDKFRAFVRSLTHLTELSLAGLNTGIGEQIALARSIHAPELVKLKFSYPSEYGRDVNPLAPAEAPQLAVEWCNVLARCPLLRSATVKFRREDTCTAAVTRILTGLAQLPELKHLDVTVPDRYRCHGDADLQAYEAALSRCVGLTELSVCTEQGAVRPFLSLEALPALQLRIDDSGLPPVEDVRGVVLRLGALARLTRLHLIGNCFVRAAALEGIAKALACMTGMHELSLDLCGLGRTTRARGSATPVIGVLPELHALVKFELKMPRIAADDVAELVRVLPRLNALRFLAVGTWVNQTSAKALADAAPAGVEVILHS